jgi:uncharacterized membrane protein YccC
MAEVRPRSSWRQEVFRADELRALAVEAFAVQEHGVDIRSGLAGAVATAAPLAVGVAAGDRPAGLVAALGGLNIALVVPRADWRSRLWWGTVGLAGGCVSVALASLTSGHTWLLVLTSILWVGTAAFLRAAGRPGALAGFVTGAVFVVVSGLPYGTPPLGTREIWFTVGGSAGLLLMVAARRGPPGPASLPRTTLAAVRAGASQDAAVRSFAVRLALAVGLATAIYRVLEMPHGYWVALTVLAITQPATRATEIRSLQRAAGTLIGVLVTILITALTGDVWVLVVATAIASLGLFALDERGYFWLVVMLTPAALIMLSIGDFQGFLSGVERTLNSGLGILLGLVIGESTRWIGRCTGQD